jgi:hypothetical protein
MTPLSLKNTIRPRLVPFAQFANSEMAEIAGVGLSVISMAALFNNALDCLQLVRVGKAFGEDYDTFQIRISLLQLRPSQWGEAAGLDKAKEGELLPSRRRTPRRLVKP